MKAKQEAITITVNYKEKRVLLSDYIAAKTKALQDFGYPTLTEAEVEKAVRSILNGEEQSDVIGMMCEGDIVLNKTQQNRKYGSERN